MGVTDVVFLNEATSQFFQQGATNQTELNNGSIGRSRTKLRCHYVDITRKPLKIGINLTVPFDVSM
jgi:hypothetical protein